MLKKLVEAEEKAPPETKKDAPAQPEAPAETETSPPATEPAEPDATPPAEAETPAEPDAPTGEEKPAEEAETPAEEKPKKQDESEKSVKKIEDLSKNQIINDYSLTSELKALYQPILNAKTLKEKTSAVKTYQKIINKLITQSQENEKIKEALEKTREFIKADSKLLSDKLFKKLKI